MEKAGAYRMGSSAANAEITSIPSTRPQNNAWHVPAKNVGLPFAPKSCWVSPSRFMDEIVTVDEQSSRNGKK